jgi:hypothetical protein
MDAPRLMQEVPDLPGSDRLAGAVRAGSRHPLVHQRLRHYFADVAGAATGPAADARGGAAGGLREGIPLVQTP